MSAQSLAPCGTTSALGDLQDVAALAHVEDGSLFNSVPSVVGPGVPAPSAPLGDLSVNRTARTLAREHSAVSAVSIDSLVPHASAEDVFASPPAPLERVPLDAFLGGVADTLYRKGKIELVFDDHSADLQYLYGRVDPVNVGEAMIRVPVRYIEALAHPASRQVLTPPGSPPSSPAGGPRNEVEAQALPGSRTPTGSSQRSPDPGNEPATEPESPSKRPRAGSDNKESGDHLSSRTMVGDGYPAWALQSRGYDAIAAVGAFEHNPPVDRGPWVMQVLTQGIPGQPASVVKTWVRDVVQEGDDESDEEFH